MEPAELSSNSGSAIRANTLMKNLILSNCSLSHYLIFYEGLDIFAKILSDISQS